MREEVQFYGYRLKKKKRSSEISAKILGRPKWLKKSSEISAIVEKDFASRAAYEITAPGGTFARYATVNIEIKVGIYW